MREVSIEKLFLCLLIFLRLIAFLALTGFEAERQALEEGYTAVHQT